jgi:hypothetical protein
MNSTLFPGNYTWHPRMNCFLKFESRPHNQLTGNSLEQQLGSTFTVALYIPRL